MSKWLVRKLNYQSGKYKLEQIQIWQNLKICVISGILKGVGQYMLYTTSSVSLDIGKPF